MKTTKPEFEAGDVVTLKGCDLQMVVESITNDIAKCIWMAEHTDHGSTWYKQSETFPVVCLESDEDGA